MSGVRKATVGPGESGQRLDNWLVRELKGCPKTLIYRLIRKGEVRVNGRRAKPMQKLATGDEVRIPPVRRPETHAAVAPKDKVEELKPLILVSDRHFVVVDKPGGWAVHGGTGLAWGVIDLLQAMPTYAEAQLAHRIDRDTSGCLVCARSRPALLAFQEAMKTGRVTKKYLAKLQGVLREPTTVDVPLRKVHRGAEQMVEVSEDGKHAVSHFTPLDWTDTTTLCEVHIETGRTHQIRVHAAHLGTPILGDERYGTGRRDGLKLHCAHMAFDWDEKGYQLSASAPLPGGW